MSSKSETNNAYVQMVNDAQQASASTAPKVKKSRTVFATIMRPLAFLLALEGLFLIGTLVFSGITEQLDQNARDILQQQVEQRGQYWESAMVGTWADLSLLAEEINDTTQTRLENTTLQLEDLSTSNEESNWLLALLVDNMTDELYSKKTSGLFIIFCDSALPAADSGQTLPTCPGLYIINQTPSTAPTSYREDLYVQRGALSLLSRLGGIPCSTDWQPLFDFNNSDIENLYDVLYQPVMAAVNDGSQERATDYGYWHAAFVNGSATLYYSIPLILEDGTVYGVVGVSMKQADIINDLPYNDLYEDQQGSYVLGIEQNDQFLPVLVNGAISQEVKAGTWLAADAAQAVQQIDASYYAATGDISLYNRTSPFAEQQWKIIGVVHQERLYSFSREIVRLLFLAMVCTLLAGALGSVLISRRLSRPIAKLAKEVDKARANEEEIPALSRTGIEEVDHFAAAITELSHESLENATKFLSIMDLASVEMGGFRVKRDDNTLFVTRNFFSMFGRADLDSEGMTKERFVRTIRRIHAGDQHTQNSDGSLLYAVPLPEGGVRYLRLETAWDGDVCVGLVEDVTQTTKERMRIEHERDYDLLTGLYNRRAFVREAEELFAQPHAMGVGAVMMVDLDNLKMVNDNFGHEYGDRYLRRAALCIADTGTLCARVAGDEFYLLFYGHACKETVRAAVDRLCTTLNTSEMELPNGATVTMHASGGLAWYPDNGTSLTELMRLADFAMYQIKKHGKGAVGEFDAEAYAQEQRLLELRQEFQLLLAQEQLTYFFQPIVDANTGETHAYEALMRTVGMPTLRSPQDVIDLARMDNKLGEIERLTWFKASAAYQSLLERGEVDPSALMFINSIANECLDAEVFARYHELYADVQARTVIEITEQDGLDLNATALKRTRPGSTGLLALDDYGSGYNSEKNLLALAPNYIKIDMEIIRDIDKDKDKQQLVDNTVKYARNHGMLVIAEGLETPEEVTMVLQLGVDLLQGYYLAKPAAVPSRPSQASLDLLAKLRRKDTGANA